MITTDPGTQLRRDIAYNTSNFGELGKYIRIEHILNILDRYTITSHDGNQQLNRFQQAQKAIHEPLADERTMLTTLYRLLA